MTPSSIDIISSESYDLKDQTANSGGCAGTSVVHDQSFSKYWTNYKQKYEILCQLFNVQEWIFHAIRSTYSGHN